VMGIEYIADSISAYSNPRVVIEDECCV